MLVAVQLLMVAATPLNVIVPCVLPKPLPLTVTDAPTGAETGERFVIIGGIVTAKGAPLLDKFPTVITTLPVVAPDGTVATMLVSVQLLAVATTPLNVRRLDP